MSRDDMSDPVLWRVTTTRHDWGDGAYLARLFALWSEAGLVGPAEWASGRDDKPFRVAPDGKVAATLLAAPRRRDAINATVGGSAPHAWKASLMLWPFDPDLGRTDAYNILNLEVPRSACMALSSVRLLDMFEQAHGPDDTEFAAIHPNAHWAHLQGSAFVPALTIGPMFAGLYWADFLGPGTIEHFRREVIDGLDVARRRWHGTRGVTLAVTDDLATSDTRETESRLVAMTDELRRTMMGS